MSLSHIQSIITAIPISQMIVIAIMAVVFIILLVTGLCSPFHYPYFTHAFNVSKKRNPQIEDYIDDFLIDDGMEQINHHQQLVDNWKNDSEKRIRRSLFRHLRKKQYLECLDDDNAYHFLFTRNQTRYTQQYYVKSSYKVKTIDKEYGCSYEYLCRRDQKLSGISYECGLRAYHSKNQRRLMTPELRKQIAERDHYTCQICGKYMPDGVGLHIDHIIPVSKGGKTVPSNLQVLCSKCNGHKSDQISL